jgi:hypothetical protein
MSYLGALRLSPVHRGTTYTSNKQVYALCNGQALSRTTYPSFSALWPEGAYGSSAANIHLPDLGANDGYFLRGADLGRGADPNVSARSALSGSAPVTSGVGSIQTANFATHTHPSGVQGSFRRSTGGGDGNCCYPVEGSKASNGPSTISGPTAVGSAAATEFDLAHMKVYPYIRVL